MIPNIGGPELLILFVFIAALVFILLLVSRLIGNQSPPGGSRSDAKGEIGREEYERVRRDIES